jgi:hypothetical protein
MAINSRTKGNKGERIAAAVLQGWTNKEFSRTPSSGGLQWKSSNSKGDIICTTEGHFFPFCIEVKLREKVDFSMLLRPDITKKNLIANFWAQCTRDADLAHKIPMLMFRYNGMPKSTFFILLPMSIMSTFIGKIETVLYTRDLVFINSSELHKIPYKDIKALAKKIIKQTWIKNQPQNMSGV